MVKYIEFKTWLKDYENRKSEVQKAITEKMNIISGLEPEIEQAVIDDNTKLEKELKLKSAVLYGEIDDLQRKLKILIDSDIKQSSKVAGMAEAVIAENGKHTEHLQGMYDEKIKAYDKAKEEFNIIAKELKDIEAAAEVLHREMRECTVYIPGKENLWPKPLQAQEVKIIG